MASGICFSSQFPLWEQVDSAPPLHNDHHAPLDDAYWVLFGDDLIRKGKPFHTERLAAFGGWVNCFSKLDHAQPTFVIPGNPSNARVAFGFRVSERFPNGRTQFRGETFAFS